MSKHRDYVIQKRKREAKQKKRIGAVLGFFMISIASIGFGAVFASAHGTSKEEPVSYKYYKSIEIKDGDTLWSIAKEYMTSDYESIEDYIDELRELNQLGNDHILISGKHLNVVYYNVTFQ